MRQSGWAIAQHEAAREARVKLLLTLGLTAAALMIGSCGFGGDEEEAADNASDRAQRAALAAAGIDAFEAGSWSQELSIVSIDLPAMARSKEKKIRRRLEESVSGAVCLASDEAAAPPAHFFMSDGEECRYSSFENDGNKLKIALSCRMESLSAIDVEMAGPIEVDSYQLDGDISIRLPMIGEVTAQAQLRARHAGPCR